MTGQSSLLTMDVDEKIIDAVHEFPSLREVSSKAYKDAIAKGNAWKEVSNKVTTHTRVFLCSECLKCYCVYLDESISRGVSKKVAVVKG